jgi:hypothetical protein
MHSTDIRLALYGEPYNVGEYRGYPGGKHTNRRPRGRTPLDGSFFGARASLMKSGASVSVIMGTMGNLRWGRLGRMRPTWATGCQTGLLALLLAMSIQVFMKSNAATTVYRCTKDGQTVLTDKPCDVPPVSSVAGETAEPATSGKVLPSSSRLSPVGHWAGQSQYHATENGRTLQDAHSVVLLSLDFTTDGKVAGASAENRCRVLGVWTQDSNERIVWLDVTLNECTYSSMNRRYSGNFTLARPDSSAQLYLVANELPHSGQGGRMYDVKGTLRR